jgi:AcrR family transcriptional regulator
MTQTLPQRRRDLVRREIGTIGIDLFVERGFDAVTVDDISAAAGISQRTFFRYFATKDEITLDLMRRLDDRLVAAVAARPADEGPITALREGFRATSRMEPGARTRVLRLAEVMESVPGLRARAQGERLLGPGGLVHRLTDLLAPGRSDRRLRTAISAMVAVASIEFERWADAGGRGDLSKQIGEALQVLHDGLAALDAR